MMKEQLKVELYGNPQVAAWFPHGSTMKAPPMNELGPYVVSIQAQPFRRKTRYHWMICQEQTPDELVSWGHAPTQELAETEARNEVRDLASGLTQGGRVASTAHWTIHHC
jgi:hypothetical protein